MKRFYSVLAVFSFLVVLFSFSHASAAIKTPAQLDRDLKFGRNTAVALDWDSSAYPYPDSCREEILNPANGYSGLKGSLLYSEITKGGSGSSYRFENWLSKQGQGNASSPIVVPYGTSTIDLQINSLSFTCRPFAEPIVNRSCDLTGTQWTNTATGWIKDISVGDSGIHLGSQDYSTPASNSCFINLKDWQHIRLYSMSGTDGTVARTGPDRLSMDRDVDSRFWFASPVNITYTSDTPLTSSKTITVTYRYKQQNGYTSGVTCTRFDSPDQPNPQTTATGPPGIEIAWGMCKEKEADLTVSIIVADPIKWTVSGTTTGTGNPVAGGSLSWNHSVKNDGPDATDKPVDMKVFRKIDNNTPVQIASSTAASGSAMGALWSRASSYGPITAADVGKTFCEYVTWTPTAWNNAGGTSSTPVCFTVVASPRIAIVGADAASGGSTSCTSAKLGGFNGSTTSSPQSFGEYGLLATGDMLNFNSSGFSPTPTNNLSFANTGLTAPATAGYYSANRCIKDLATSLTKNVAFTDILPPPTELPDPGNWKITSDVELDSTNLMTTGERRLIYAPNNIVTIRTDLKYDNGPYASYNDVPSLIIIAKKIRILGDVERIDGLFIASETFSTCGEAGDSVDVDTRDINLKFLVGTTDICRSSQLVINGAVVAKEFTAARSFEGNPGSPAAEIVRFRPEVFLGPFERSMTGVTLKTDTETELPPRN